MKFTVCVLLLFRTGFPVKKVKYIVMPSVIFVIPLLSLYNMFFFFYFKPKSKRVPLGPRKRVFVKWHVRWTETAGTRAWVFS